MQFCSQHLKISLRRIYRKVIHEFLTLGNACLQWTISGSETVEEDFYVKLILELTKNLNSKKD